MKFFVANQLAPNTPDCECARLVTAAADELQVSQATHTLYAEGIVFVALIIAMSPIA